LGGLDALAELNGKFEIVYSINVAMFWRDRPSALRVIHDAMRTGGLLATTYQPRHGRAKSSDAFKFAEDLSEAMGTLGFIDIRSEQLALQPVPAVCVLGRRGE
jgi:hypothetical protein